MRASGVFVGRDGEIEVLLAALDDAFSGQGSLFLIGGAPGIGKSRLAEELGARARQRGARVLWGRCWEEGGAPAYWPWVQPFRSYLREADPTTLRMHLGAVAPELARMLPELRELFPDIPAPTPLDSEAARFRLFDAASSLLRSASRAQPLVLVLDDLHAADTPSLLLLRFLAGQLGESRIVVLGTYRDTELGPNHPLSATLGDLAREHVTRGLPLGGFAEPDVARFIEVTAGLAPSVSVVAAVYRETEGNPLFIAEVVRLLSREGRLTDVDVLPGSLPIPLSVRQAVSRTVGQLSEECRRVLTLASVLGREFGLDALERIGEVSREELLDVLEESLEARLVTEVPPGRFRFSHALVRDAIYDGLPATRRVRIHQRALAVLEALYAPALDPHLAELATHALKSAPGGDVAKAIDYARRAGDRAAHLLGYEEAVRLYGMALDALELKEPADENTRCELLLSLGDARMRAGDAAKATASFRRAADIARALRSPAQLARAALGYGGRFPWAAARGDRHLVDLLGEAAAVLGGDESILRARVLARLAAALRDSPPARERRTSLSEESVAIARQRGDPGTLAYAIEVRYLVVYGPDSAEERLALATELAGLAEQSLDRERMLQAHHWGLMTHWELGDKARLDRELQAQAQVADELRQPAQHWYTVATQAMQALFQGRFAMAEELSAQAFRLGQAAQSWNADQSFWLQTWALRRELGQLEEVEEQIQRLIGENPAVVYWRCVLGLLQAELGRTEDARRTFEELSRDDFGALPRDEDWLFAMAVLSDVCAVLGDAERAETLHALLVPYASRMALSPPNLCTGSISRSLGLLAATKSRWDEAESRFRYALEANAKMGARPWLARAQRDYARMLVARKRPGDRETAHDLLEKALTTCQELGMATVAESAAPRLPVETAPQPTAHSNVFRREGEYWTIAYEGEVLRVKDSKGLRYIARLLGEPGRELHASVLLAGEGGFEVGVGATLATMQPTYDAGGVALGLGDAGPILDAEAKASYRRRLAELDEEIEEADAWRDSGRAARAKGEKDFLLRELAAALGLGGRERRAASAVERARLNVTRAIRAALLRLGEHSPALGRHLAGTIRTGMFCSYARDLRAASWSV